MKKFYNILYNLFLRLRDAIYGVDFTSNKNVIDVNMNPERVYRSTPSGDLFLKRALKNTSIKSTDSILDVGCGKGSALLVFSKFAFNTITRVEISPTISQIAKNNFKKMNLEKISIETSDILDFSEIHNFNYYYLYNPFDKYTFTKFIKKIIETQKQNNRVINIIYNNPVNQDILLNNGFILLKTFKDRWGNGIAHYILLGN